MTITPGGNQVCEWCCRWYGPGQKDNHDCGTCMCGEFMRNHGVSDPPHMPISQEDYYREQGVE